MRDLVPPWRRGVVCFPGYVSLQMLPGVGMEDECWANFQHTCLVPHIARDANCIIKWPSHCSSPWPNRCPLSPRSIRPNRPPWQRQTTSVRRACRYFCKQHTTAKPLCSRPSRRYRGSANNHPTIPLGFLPLATRPNNMHHDAINAPIQPHPTAPSELRVQVLHLPQTTAPPEPRVPPIPPHLSQSLPRHQNRGYPRAYPDRSRATRTEGVPHTTPITHTNNKR